MTLPDTLPAALAGALSARGYTDLTQVQSAVLVPHLSDKDLLVSAQTGSGTTVAFGLAMAEALLSGEDTLSPASEPLALIVAPTRELAMQVARELGWLYGIAGARLATCVGGMDMRDERRALERGAHIVIGTPGRLADHIKRGSLVTAGVSSACSATPRFPRPGANRLRLRRSPARTMRASSRTLRSARRPTRMRNNSSNNCSPSMAPTCSRCASLMVWAHACRVGAAAAATGGHVPRRRPQHRFDVRTMLPCCCTQQTGAQRNTAPHSTCRHAPPPGAPALLAVG